MSGDFAIVPSTERPGDESNFFMRVYVEQEVPEMEEAEFRDDDENSFW